MPRYLRTRKQEWRRDEERREAVRAADPECPPGHVRLTEEERTAALEALNERYEELLRRGNRLPVRHAREGAKIGLTFPLFAQISTRSKIVSTTLDRSCCNGFALFY